MLSVICGAEDWQCAVFVHCISCRNAQTGQGITPNHSVLVLTGFYHRADSHSIWPVRTRSGVGAVLTTQSSLEICGGPRQAQAQTAIVEVRGQPLRYCLWAELPENDSVFTHSL